MIRIFTCGGTIDKVYFDASSQYQVGGPHIGRVLAQMHVTAPFTVTELMRKDSIDMDEADRELIRAAVLTCAEKHILITHGTDTLIDTARYLSAMPDKRVVCTGAMLPGSMLDSDAVFNIAFALGVLVAEPAKLPTVMVAMGGQVFDPACARKNKALGRFESLA